MVISWSAYFCKLYNGVEQGCTLPTILFAVCSQAVQVTVNSSGILLRKYWVISSSNDAQGVTQVVSTLCPSQILSWQDVNIINYYEITSLQMTALSPWNSFTFLVTSSWIFSCMGVNHRPWLNPLRQRLKMFCLYSYYVQSYNKGSSRFSCPSQQSRETVGGVTFSSLFVFCAA